MEGSEVTRAGTRASGLVHTVAGVCVGTAYELHPHMATPKPLSPGPREVAS